MSTPFREEDLRAYTARGWANARASKHRTWAQHAAEHGPQGGFEVSGQLWDHARSLDATWPDPSTRQRDLQHHIAVLRMMDRLRDVDLPS